MSANIVGLYGVASSRGRSDYDNLMHHTSFLLEVNNCAYLVCNLICICESKFVHLIVFLCVRFET